ncbi:MAG: signal recognition particle-docking protein FtsY [Rickettsiales bacterium]|jgi:fused signal recognition particle receptor|nr:signal recognition particle-docking protein FtsY [Rickettsiales bacterium]
MFKFFSTIKKEDQELVKSSNKIKNGLYSIFAGKKLDGKSIAELEDLLITSDISIGIVNEVVEFLEKNRFDKETTTDEIKEIIFHKLKQIFREIDDDCTVNSIQKPYAMMFLGVNGSGKTTVVGKIANGLRMEGQKVLLAACDTFRAGATEQLCEWSGRAGVDVVKPNKNNEDTAAVAYRAMLKAQADNYDALLIDTAGRLQNNVNLMDELVKVNKVLKKIDMNMPSKNILVLDATIGQNSMKQFELFDKSVRVDGIIMNKMDSTSKGGILISIVKKFKKPIYALGVGEKINDIKSFDADEFLKSLLGIE